jgi:CRISPR system Cascade subunit CasA
MHAFLALESDTNESFQTSELINQLGELEAEQRIPDDYPLRVETFGMVYGTQSAVVDDLLHDAIPLPVAALRGRGDAYALVLEATSQAEQLAAALNDLSADLRRAAGADPIPWDKGQRPGEQLLYALDPLVRRLLSGVSTASEDTDILDRGQLAWEQMAYREVRRTAAPLFAVPATTFLGRLPNTDTTKDIKNPQGLGWAANKFSGRVNRILPRAAASRSS